MPEDVKDCFVHLYSICGLIFIAIFLLPLYQTARRRPQTTQNTGRREHGFSSRAISAPSNAGRVASRRSNIPDIIVGEADAKSPSSDDNMRRSAGSRRPQSSSSGLSSKLSSKPDSFKSRLSAWKDEK
ncbi:hypothetical protein BaRGS_00023821 [Batillaria attramentaria]|uniref:Uncharacterized protein n=1 Tax=Batillaria attramentaria TaxID=370345 RepID=A0ABD0KCK9_9CAEN